MRLYYKNYVWLAGLGLATMLMTSGCYYDKEETLYPPKTGGCDSVNVKYAADVKIILQDAGCVGCHPSGTGSGGVSLETYEEVKACALSGGLYNEVSTGGMPPPPAPKLPDCTIKRLKGWIDAGAPNN